MARAFVSLGSNIDPAGNVRRAIGLLAREARVAAISTVYSTEPLGRPEQPSYYNCVVEIETDTPPADLRRLVLRRIEEDLGRRRTEDKYAARTIDLDLIAYDDLALETEDLRLPDPDIARRPFLAVALAELAPELALPGLASSAAKLAAALPRAGMSALEDYTGLLRRGIARER